MMERQGLVSRRVGSGTYLTEDAHEVFEKMDQTSMASHAGGAELPSSRSSRAASCSSRR